MHFFCLACPFYELMGRRLSDHTKCTCDNERTSKWTDKRLNMCEKECFGICNRKIRWLSGENFERISLEWGWERIVKRENFHIFKRKPRKAFDILLSLLELSHFPWKFSFFFRYPRSFRKMYFRNFHRKMNNFLVSFEKQLNLEGRVLIS